MTCKHRWEPFKWCKYQLDREYTYQCTRCNKTIGAILKEKQNGN
jgi:hypothetical protein